MNKTLYTFTMCATAMLFGCAPADQDGAMELSTVKTDDELSAKIELLFDKYIQNEWDVMDLYAEDVVCKINNVEFSGRDNLMGGFKMHHDALYSNIAIKDMRIQSEYWSDGEIGLALGSLGPAMAKPRETATPTAGTSATSGKMGALLNFMAIGAKMFKTQKQRLMLQPTRANDLCLSTPQESQDQIRRALPHGGLFFCGGRTVQGIMVEQSCAGLH